MASCEDWTVKIVNSMPPSHLVDLHCWVVSELASTEGLLEPVQLCEDSVGLIH